MPLDRKVIQQHALPAVHRRTVIVGLRQQADLGMLAPFGGQQD
jgi:hypothetical protein